MDRNSFKAFTTLLLQSIDYVGNPSDVSEIVVTPRKITVRGLARDDEGKPGLVRDASGRRTDMWRTTEWSVSITDEEGTD